MWVKVDYSTEAKKNPRPNMGGQWSIYVKRHWWNKWVERDTFADIDWCTHEAKQLHDKCIDALTRYVDSIEKENKDK